VKKLVNWYNVLLREFPDFFMKEKKSLNKSEGEDIKSSTVPEKKSITESAEDKSGNKNKKKK
jgi:hypothetical protein